MNSFSVKKTIAKNFSRAATRYDQFAPLQQKVGLQLLTRFKNADFIPSHIIDIGAGTGLLSQLLAENFPDSLISCVDLSYSMSAEAKKRLPQVICADFDALPFADKSVDGLFSNFALQWSLDPFSSFAELKRILKPGGLLVFSSLGPRTLYELKQSWQKNTLKGGGGLCSQEIESILKDLGFHNVKLETQMETQYSDQVSDIFRDLKNIGAHTVIGKKAHLLGKARFQGLLQSYENYRNKEGLLPASFEVILGTAHA